MTFHMLNNTLPKSHETWEKYSSLTGETKMFADILILIFEPVNYFQCETFINRLKLGKNSINYFKQQALLSKLGILCFEGTSYFYVHPYVAVNAFPVLARDKSYKDVIDKIRISFSSADNFYYNYRPVSYLL